MSNDADFLLPGERIDDLQWMGLRVIQSPRAFRFGMDAVLLADFAQAKPRSRVCDLGTGTGILPLLLYGREQQILCDAVEIQPDAAERAARTMRLNGLADKITVHRQDLRSIRDFLPRGEYDLVICNPPYSAQASSLPSPNPALRAARQEGDCTLADVADAAKWLLRHHGRLALMLPTARLSDAFDVLRARRLEPKRLRLVHAGAEKPARLALIEALLFAHPGLTVDPPLITLGPDGRETAEVRRIYHMKEE